MTSPTSERRLSAASKAVSTYLYDRGTVVRRSRGGMAGGDDGLLRIAGLELFRQSAVTELAADLGGLETVAVVGELQPVDFPLLVLHAVDRDAASI